MPTPLRQGAPQLSIWPTSAVYGVSDAGAPCFGEKLAGKFGFFVRARDR